MDEYQRFFGANIRKLRKLHGLPQEQLAERSGLSERYVSEVERGVANPRLMSFKALASGLGVAIPDLFVFDNSPLTASEIKERLIEALSQTDEKSLEHIYNSMVFALNKTRQ